MGGAAGVASTRKGKEISIGKIKSELEGCEMIFAIPSSNIEVNQVTTLRKSLPENTTAKVVKNKLMERAVMGTEWEAVSGEMLKGENMWFFVRDDISGSIKILKKFLKDNGKDQTHQPKFGVIEGGPLDAEGVEAISKLPTKQELYQKIAVSINLVPTKIARGINLVPTKVGRSVKLAFAEEKSDS
eukprot:CAMPEP_0171455382 /NCGR_PEP_ID=MMETSP0945-20130129/2301_1 /TAXON_ID=109269 /ORGANISM="Vaucheria litorea, Strain CCMP2940" /LENGTH=185 /DNA_ID=CAMNT_0011980615 /DNA_START=167 /DNA_END=724 /DNA_ORIENTATION=-